MIFTENIFSHDEDFVKHLTQNRNVFQKIYDEVKYLLKVATAGSKEAKELERVKYAFEQAYKADSNPQVYEAYLNIKNPLDMDAQADPAEWTNAFPDADFPTNGTNEDFYRAVEEFYAYRYIKIKIYCREVLSTFANVYTMLINEV